MAEIVQIDSATWSFEDGFVRFFLLVGEKKAAMIDSGANCKEALELAKTLTDKEIILINTHGDGDHTSGTGSFSQIYIHVKDYEGCGVKDKFPDTALADLSHIDIIDLGNRPLRIIPIPGHTGGSVAILDINRRVLYSGDSVQRGHIFMFGKHRTPEAFEDSLVKLIDIKNEYDYIYASHDECILPADYVEKVRTAWQQVQTGKLPFENMDLFGNRVKSFTAEACGFYTEY